MNKLEAADITTGTPDDIPTGKGIIYFKTDVEVKGAAKTYTFKLLDKKGLKSSEIAVSTSKTQAEDAKLFYNSTDISTQAGNSSSPYPINTDSPVTVKAKTETSGATIRGTLFKKESGTWSDVNGIDNGSNNEVNITLSPLSTIGSTIEYKISLTTGSTGFAAGTAKEFYVNVKRSSIITINGADDNAWSKLKTEVEKLSDGAEIIKINGTITAKNGDTKIEVKRAVKIMGKNGKTSDILNADNQTFIFDIWSSGKLTLEKLTLQNGKNTDNFRGGGAIYCAGGELTTDDISIENCTATQKNGGAIFAQGATVNITSCTFTGNKADKQGGAVYFVGISGGTIGGTGEGEANKAIGPSGIGGGIYIEANTTVTLQNDAQIIGNEAEYGGGVYLLGNESTLKIKGDAIVDTNNDVYLNYGSGQAKITVDSVLTGTAPVARITVPNDKYAPTTQVLTAGSGVTLANETYKFAVTPKIVGSTPQPWTVDGNGYLKQGRYTEVPYGQLEAYLANASATEVNYIEVTGISPADLTGSYASPPDPGALGQKIKNNSSKKVALKLPSGLSVTDMSYCFASCTNLISVENIPSGVTNMEGCFYKCENLTTVPAIPATVTGMKECFCYCTSLTTALNIPAGVYDMTRCFQNCKKLQSIKMNCSYVVGNFNSAFGGCDALPNGGIQVPSAQLTTYKDNAVIMGTEASKFAAIP